jgi:membrane associated rhomboid family serine protease
VTHVVTQPESAIPPVGASGAIAGVLGAYLLLSPMARLVVMFPVLFLPFSLSSLLCCTFARAFSFSCSAAR